MSSYNYSPKVAQTEGIRNSVLALKLLMAVNMSLSSWGDFLGSPSSGMVRELVWSISLTRETLLIWVLWLMTFWIRLELRVRMEDWSSAGRTSLASSVFVQIRNILGCWHTLERKKYICKVIFYIFHLKIFSIWTPIVG